MKQELGPLQKKLVESLESGKYKQGPGLLLSKNKQGKDIYCCLGVAAEILNLPKLYIEKELSLTDNGEWEKLALRNGFGKLKYKAYNKQEDEYYDDLVTMNDSGFWSFKEIAKYIRENPENVFTKAV